MPTPDQLALQYLGGYVDPSDYANQKDLNAALRQKEMVRRVLAEMASNAVQGDQTDFGALRQAMMQSGPHQGLYGKVTDGYGATEAEANLALSEALRLAEEQRMGNGQYPIEAIKALLYPKPAPPKPAPPAAQAATAPPVSRPAPASSPSPSPSPSSSPSAPPVAATESAPSGLVSSPAPASSPSASPSSSRPSPASPPSRASSTSHAAAPSTTFSPVGISRLRPGVIGNVDAKDNKIFDALGAAIEHTGPTTVAGTQTIPYLTTLGNMSKEGYNALKGGLSSAASAGSSFVDKLKNLEGFSTTALSSLEDDVMKKYKTSMFPMAEKELMGYFNKWRAPDLPESVGDLGEAASTGESVLSMIKNQLRGLPGKVTENLAPGMGLANASMSLYPLMKDLIDQRPGMAAADATMMALGAKLASNPQMQQMLINNPRLVPALTGATAGYDTADQLQRALMSERDPLKQHPSRLLDLLGALAEGGAAYAMPDKAIIPEIGGALTARLGNRYRDPIANVAHGLTHDMGNDLYNKFQSWAHSSNTPAANTSYPAPADTGSSFPPESYQSKRYGRDLI
jgi:hypothetical protein